MKFPRQMAALGLLHFQQLLHRFAFLRAVMSAHHAALCHETQCTALRRAFQPQPVLSAVCRGMTTSHEHKPLSPPLAEMEIEVSRASEARALVGTANRSPRRSVASNVAAVRFASG
jgi:hypothetical protein